jgi:hypothetical protein
MGKIIAYTMKLGVVSAVSIALAGWHHGHLQQFLLEVHDVLARRLPKRLRDYEWRSRSSLLQVYFDEPSVHYEVWVQRKTGSVEIGLHFEGDRDVNYRWAELLGGHALEIQGALGPAVELEEWTQKWTRLHEQRSLAHRAEWRPKDDLTPELADEIGGRLAEFIETLEPIVRKERKHLGGAKAKTSPASRKAARPARKPAVPKRRR